MGVYVPYNPLQVRRHNSKAYENVITKPMYVIKLGSMTRFGQFYGERSHSILDWCQDVYPEKLEFSDFSLLMAQNAENSNEKIIFIFCNLLNGIC